MYSNLKSEIKHFLFPLLETPTRHRPDSKLTGKLTKTSQKTISVISLIRTNFSFDFKLI
jgi:hypothetical protein